MYSVSQVISTNGAAIVLLLSLLLNFRRKYRTGRGETRAFFLMLLVNLAQCIIEPATFLLEGQLFPGAVALNTALNALLYINNILFAMLWSLYADLHMNHRVNTLAARLTKFGPAALVIALALINLATPVFFAVSAENVYSRTDFVFFPYLISYIYLLRGTFVAYNFKDRVGRYVILPAFTFLGPVVIASVVQFACLGLSLLWAGAAIGLASAYISLLDECASVDALSGAYSRHYMNIYLTELPRTLSEGHRIAAIMIDIDRFKSINDTYGHPVGDDAIHQVGRALHRAIGRGDMLFRYAGDEFFILTEIEREAEVDALIARIHAEAAAINATGQKPYRISLSAGYAIREGEESVGAFLRRTDEAMYVVKNAGR